MEDITFKHKIFSMNMALDDISLESNAYEVLVTDLFDEAMGCDNLLKRYSSKDFNVTGVDISDLIVDRVKKKYPDIVQCQDIRDLTFPDESFDLIVSPSTLDHFPKKQLIRSLDELKRVCKRDGVVILIINNKHDIWQTIRLGKIFRKCSYEHYFYSKNELSMLCRNLGFTPVYTTAIDHVPLSAIGYYGMSMLGRRMKESNLYKLFGLIEIQRKFFTRFFTGTFLFMVLKKQ